MDNRNGGTEGSYSRVENLKNHLIKVNRIILYLLAIYLLLGCGNEILIKKDISGFFELMSYVLLGAAAVHLASALCYNSQLVELKKEFIAAILMSAFSITLVLLHASIEMVIRKSEGCPEHGFAPYNRSDLLLIAFLTTGGIFMVATIYFVINGNRSKEG